MFKCSNFTVWKILFHLLPVNKLKNKLIIPLPTFLSNPDCVLGIPVWRAKRCFAADIPKALFHEKEKPYLDILHFFCYSNLPTPTWSIGTWFHFIYNGIISIIRLFGINLKISFNEMVREAILNFLIQ